MVRMAAPRMTEKAFRSLVGTYTPSGPLAASAAPQPPSDLFNRRPMYLMAAIPS